MGKPEGPFNEKASLSPFHKKSNKKKIVLLAVASVIVVFSALILMYHKGWFGSSSKPPLRPNKAKPKDVPAGDGAITIKKREDFIGFQKTEPDSTAFTTAFLALYRMDPYRDAIVAMQKKSGNSSLSKYVYELFKMYTAAKDDVSINSTMIYDENLNAPIDYLRALLDPIMAHPDLRDTVCTRLTSDHLNDLVVNKSIWTLKPHESSLYGSLFVNIEYTTTKMYHLVFHNKPEYMILESTTKSITTIDDTINLMSMTYPEKDCNYTLDAFIYDTSVGHYVICFKEHGKWMLLDQDDIKVLSTKEFEAIRPRASVYILKKIKMAQSGVPESEYKAGITK